jgi:chemotaxis protein CheC
VFDARRGHRDEPHRQPEAGRAGVTEHEDGQLSASQLEALRRILHQGASKASAALERWIGKPTSITIDAVEQLPLANATELLGPGDEPVGFCVAAMTGRLTGQLILAFDDASGLSLADLLLNQPKGTSATWGEMEISAALETTNIVGSTYLNVLAETLPATGEPSEVLLSPPSFNHDFAASVIEFALMGQITAVATVLLARTRFRIDGDPVAWTMLLVPDASTMCTLRELL